jgi:MPBQ/MSBQ methyltransferase
MPDKEKYVQEMARVLKPGGRLVIATWCQRDLKKGEEFTPKERAALALPFSYPYPYPYPHPYP